MRVTIHDCEVQHFRGSGKGGQNRNKRDTGTRVIHRPSGAVAESCEERSQLQNKRRAFVRMAQSARFKAWAYSQLGLDEEIPPATSTARIRTYNVVDRYIKDHRTDKKSSAIEDILDGDLDLLRTP